MQTSFSQGPLQVFKHTLQHGEIHALYTGLGLPLAAQALYKSTIFTINNVTQEFLLNWKHLERAKLGHLDEVVKLTYFDKFIYGFVGGAVNAAAFVTSVGLRGVTSSWDVIHQAVLAQPEGVRTLWWGTSWTMARDSVGCVCFFTAWRGRKMC